MSTLPSNGPVSRKTLSAASSGYDLKKMRGYHHKIIRLYVMGAILGERMTGKEIAKRIGCTPQTVYNTINSDLGQREIQVLLGKARAGTIDVLGEIQEIAPVALRELEEMLRADQTADSVKTRIAQDLLDRAGYGATQKVEVDHKVGDKEIQEIKERAKENAVNLGLIEEASYEDLPEEQDDPGSPPANPNNKADQTDADGHQSNS